VRSRRPHRARVCALIPSRPGGGSARGRPAARAPRRSALQTGRCAADGPAHVAPQSSLGRCCAPRALACSSRAAAMPAMPAPTTTTFFSCATTRADVSALGKCGYECWCGSGGGEGGGGARAGGRGERAGRLACAAARLASSQRNGRHSLPPCCARYSPSSPASLTCHEAASRGRAMCTLRCAAPRRGEEAKARRTKGPPRRGARAL
jgi:hypothetical protein